MANIFSRGYVEVVKSRSLSKRDVPAHLKVKYRDSDQAESHEGLKEELENRERDEAPLGIAGTDFKEGSSVNAKKGKYEELEVNLIDRDDSDSSSDEEEVNEDSDDDEEMAELQRELERLKRERMEEDQRQERERAAWEAKEYHEKMLNSNELLAPSDMAVKKKWYEETIFRNQAYDEPKYQKRFINDTVRNDFHRRFLNKYVK